MSRHGGGRSYGHRATELPDGGYSISWVVDYYYAGSRLRYPRTYHRMTDAVGAAKFCARWDIDLCDDGDK